MEGSSSAGSSNTEMKGFENYIPSSVQHERRYHIFLSFRGTDIRGSFAPHLYQSLVTAGFHVFLDDERLEKGENIGDSLEKAIRDSTVHIPILSPNYATSDWCLRELSLMWSCRSRGVRVIPLFYNVEPSVVRYQKDSYAKAFENYSQKGRHSEEQIGDWKQVLKQVADLSGWAYKESSAETSDGLAKRVVKDLLRTLNINYFSVAKHPVGIEARVEEVVDLLKLKDDSGRRLTVGIWGMGGLGKTTLCKALYNSIHEEFEAACFLYDIRTTAEAKGLTKLQEHILFNLEKVNIQLRSVEDGKTRMKERLSSRKALIILDDVDDEKQLDALVGDCYGSGSRIIITTRDKQMLRGQVDMTLYAMKALDPDQSLKLFSWHAFMRDGSEKKYEETTLKIVEACQGLPLSLEIIGAHLYGIRDLGIWSEVLARIQALEYEDLYKSLKISYDALSNEGKQIFLDIACFFNDPFYGCRYPYSSKEFYIEFWENLGCRTVRTSLQILQEKSLIKIGDYDYLQCLGMHDHLRDLGRRVVEEESVENPGKRSRLWRWDDITRAMTGTEKMPDIRGLMLTGGKELGHIDSLALMAELKFLCLRKVRITREIKILHPNLKYLIVDFMQSLTELTLQKCEELNNVTVSKCYCLQKISICDMRKLEALCLSWCTSLTQLPQLDLLQSLKKLTLEYCEKLQKLPVLPGSLVNLTLICCYELQEMPSMSSMHCLREFTLKGCKKLQKLPFLAGSLINLTLEECYELQEMPSMSSMHCLRELKLEKFEKLEELPALPEGLINLKVIACTNMRKLPYMSRMKKLKTLELSECMVLRELTLRSCEELNNLTVRMCHKLQNIFICDMRKLETLCLSWCESLTHLSQLDCLHSLKNLTLERCWKHQKLPVLPGSLVNLTLKYCNELQEMPIMSSMNCLRELTLRRCERLEELSALPEGLINLQVRKCKNLRKLPRMSHMKNLEILSLSGCMGLTKLPRLSCTQSLRELVLDDCVKLEELPPLKASNFINLRTVCTRGLSDKVASQIWRPCPPEGTDVVTLSSCPPNPEATDVAALTSCPLNPKRSCKKKKWYKSGTKFLYRNMFR